MCMFNLLLDNSLKIKNTLSNFYFFIGDKYMKYIRTSLLPLGK